MILKKLRLENIRSYKEATIDFPLGKTLFEGDIGSGKSTVLMGIECALFGLGSEKGGALLRAGESEGKIGLMFEVDGKEYTVVRSLAKKGKSIQQTECQLKTPEGVLSFSAGELKEKILEILNFNEPPDPKAHSWIYRYAVFTPQEEMKSIFSMSANSRLETLRRAFRIEDYRTASINAKEVSIRVKFREKEFEATASDLRELRNRLEETNAQIEARRKELEGLTNLRDSRSNQLSALTSESEQLRAEETALSGSVKEVDYLRKFVNEKNRDLGESETEIKEFEQKQRNLETRVKGLEAIEKPTEKLLDELTLEIRELKKQEKEFREKKDSMSKVVGEVPELRQQIQGKQRDIGELEKNVRVAMAKLGKLEPRIERLLKVEKPTEKDEETILKELEELKKKHKGLQKVVNSIESKIEDYEHVHTDGVCPVCDTKVNPKEFLRKIKTKDKERQKAQHEADKCEEGIGKVSKLFEELRKYTQSRTELSVLQEQAGDFQKTKDAGEKKISELRDEKEKLERRLAKSLEDLAKLEEISRKVEDYGEALKDTESLLEKKKGYDDAQEKLKESRSRISEYTCEIEKRNKKILAIKGEIDDTKKNLEIVEKRIERLNKVEERLRELNKTVEKVRGELTSITENISGINATVTGWQDETARLKQQIKGKEELQLKSDILKEYHIWIDNYFIPTLEAIEKHVMLAIRQDFEANFQEWFGTLVDDPGKDARIDEDFTPIIGQDGYEQDVNYLSGGERTSVALAYRLALNNIVRRVSTGMQANLLILDEPTDGFSKEQLVKVIGILDEIESSQVVIVSHEKELESFADQIFRVTKSQGESKIVAGS